MKKTVLLFCVLIVLCMLVIPVYATPDVTVNIPVGDGGQGSTTLIKTLGKTWFTLTRVIQLLAIGAVIFAGLRYMFASADKKADIKRRIDLVSCWSCICVWCNDNNRPCC